MATSASLLGFTASNPIRRSVGLTEVVKFSMTKFGVQLQNIKKVIYEKQIKTFNQNGYYEKQIKTFNQKG
jgi:hypothetical protein